MKKNVPSIDYKNLVQVKKFKKYKSWNPKKGSIFVILLSCFLFGC